MPIIKFSGSNLEKRAYYGKAIWRFSPQNTSKRYEFLNWKCGKNSIIPI
jgi:hypothetical protein